MYKLIGKRLDGRYEFLELIGVGGMAEVYRVYDNVKKCDVAVKVLKEEFSKNREFVRRFKNESKANASLSHPNIVRIFDVDFGDKIQYIVMEYIDGVTLKEFIGKAQTLDWKDVVHFTFQILRALQHAHDKGIVHRDMKPQNIMLLEDGTIKIMDFGIARFACDERVSVGKAIGSVHYISPEQASGGVTDAKSDLYSVGIIMYEMLTGKLPFEGKTPEMVAVKQIQAQARSPLALNPKIPQGLVDIIIRAMQKAPEKRYQSAAEMLRDIDEFKKNPDVLFEYKYLNDEGSTQYFTLSEKQSMKHVYDQGFSNKSGLYENKRGSSNYAHSSSRSAAKRKGKLIPILLGVAAGVFLVAVIIIGVFVFGMGSGNASEVEVPNFIGMKFDEVENSTAKSGDLKFVVDYEDSSDYGAGTVCKQSPSPGFKVKKNGEIRLTVSRGKKTKTVPSVCGLNYKKAQQKLNKEGFKNLNLIRRASDSVPEDCVISTDPEEGASVAPDSEIVIYYSGSSEVEKEKEKEVSVPNVVGKNVDSAKQELQKLGLEVSVVEKHESDEKEGVVISQNKKGKVKANSLAELVVNTKNADKKADKTSQQQKQSEHLADKTNNANANSGQGKQVSCSFQLNSDRPVSDTFNVVVTDHLGKVVCEGKYSTGGTVKFSAQNSNGVSSERYVVKITNTATGITAKYGTVDIDFSSDPCSVRTYLNGGAFSKTIKDNGRSASNESILS